MYAKSYENNCLNLIKISIKTFITTFYPPVPNNSTPRLLIFEVFVGTTPFSYLDPPPLPPTPLLINFLDFALQIFQRLLKRIVLFAKLYAVKCKQF